MSTRAPPTAPESPIPIALAAVFAGIAVLATLLAVAYRTPVPLAIAAPFGLSASIVWYHATGRLHRRLRRGATAGGRIGAGRRRPGDDSAGSDHRRRRARDPRAGPADGRGPAGGRTRTADGRATDHRSRAPPRDRAVPTRAEAYRTLGLDPGADAEAVRAAYRRRVKEVHPDRGGDEATFREVTAAYDRLTGDGSR